MRTGATPEEPLTPDQQRLVLSVEALVWNRAHKLATDARTPAEKEEVAAWGTLGAIVAAQRFDPSREKDFAAFAAVYIEGAILDARRRENRQTKTKRWASGLARGHLAELTPPRDIELDSRETNQARLELELQRFFMAMTGGAAASPMDIQDEAVEQLDRSRSMSLVREAMGTMVEIHRRIYALRFAQDMTHGEMVKALGLSDKTVRRRYEEMLDLLAAVLVEREVYEPPKGGKR